MTCLSFYYDGDESCFSAPSNQMARKLVSAVHLNLKKLRTFSLFTIEQGSLLTRKEI